MWTVSPDCAAVECGGAGYSLPPSLPPASALCPAGAPRGRCGPLPKGPGRPGGGAGRGRRGSHGSLLGFPDAFPSPHRKAGVGRGRAGWWGATQSFQRHFQGVGIELFCRARTEGRSDSARGRVEPALDTQPWAWERQETGPEADRLGPR